jgi:hypothetical protein
MYEAYIFKVLEWRHSCIGTHHGLMELEFFFSFAIASQGHARQPAKRLRGMEILGNSPTNSVIKRHQ